LKFWNKNCALADADVKESEKRLLSAQQEKIEIEGKNPEVEYLRDKEKFDKEERERYEKELVEWKNRERFYKAEPCEVSVYPDFIIWRKGAHGDPHFNSWPSRVDCCRRNEKKAEERLLIKEDQDILSKIITAPPQAVIPLPPLITVEFECGYDVYL
jgi:hypothetical protein